MRWHFAKLGLGRNGCPEHQRKSQESVNQQLTTLHYPESRTTTSVRFPAQPTTATSGTGLSHKIPQTLSLQPVPPRHIRNLIPRWSFVDDPPHPPPRHPAPASTLSLSPTPAPPLLPHPAAVSCFITLMFRIAHAPVLPFVPPPRSSE